MKTLKVKYAVIMVSILLLTGVSCEEKDAEKLFGINCKGVECLDLELFAKKIEEKLDGTVVKYGYRIRSGLAVHENAKGLSRTSANPPITDFTITDRFNPASVSKVITATALLRVLEQQAISINAFIDDYLPDYWNIHPTVKSITFKEVLAHTSGFRSPQAQGFSFSGVKPMIESGIKSSDKVFAYDNINYALARVLLFYAAGNPHHSGAVDADASTQFFKSYINEDIFNPIGIFDVNFTPDPAGTFFYPFPVDGKNGTQYGDWKDLVGPAGIQLSIRELSEFLMRLQTPGTYLSDKMLENMRDHKLGWFPENGPIDGTAYGHSGFFPGNKDSNGILWNGGSELNSAILRFESGVEAVLLINGYTESATSILINAYNESWKEKN